MLLLNTVASGGGTNLGGGWTLLSHTFAQGNATSAVTTSAINTTGADLLVVFLDREIATGTLTDSKTNTWTSVTTADASVYYVKAPVSAGAGHTFTNTGFSYSPIMALAFSGSSASPYNGMAHNAGIATTAINELVLAAAVGPATITAVGGGFTLSDCASYISGPSEGIGTAYQMAATVATYTPTWTPSSGFSGYITVQFLHA